MTSPRPPIDATPGRRFAFLAVLLVVATFVGWLLGFPLPMDFQGWIPVVIAGLVGVLLWAFVLPRVLPSFAARMGLLAVLGLVAGWFLVSPLFVNTTVDEALPGMAAETDGGQAPAQPGASEPAGGPAESGGNPTRVAQGAFEGIGHSAKGMVGLYELDDGSSVVRLENVEIQNGPDLFVYLVPEPGQADDAGGVNIGRLKGNIGSSNYPVPDDVDVSQFATVLVWCRAFSTPFANATLAPA